MRERPFGVFTFINPTTLLHCIMWPVHDQTQPALALVLMICLHPGNLLAPWKMPQRISSSVTACGGSVCESPPQQAPTGPLIPRIANSFWLAISRPSLSAAIAAGDEAVLQLGHVFSIVWMSICVWLQSRRDYMSGKCSLLYIQQARLWSIKVAEVIVLNYFVTWFMRIGLHISRQNNNTQRLSTVVATWGQILHNCINWTRGKDCHLKKSFHHLPFPHSGLSAWSGNYITDLFPVMMNPQPWENWPARPPFAGD